MINIKEIKYAINPVESNFNASFLEWHPDIANGWLGLSELTSVPSVFIQVGTFQVAIAIQDLQTLLAQPIAQKLLNDAENPRAK